MLGERAWLQVMTYDWPGDVRELENALERSFLFCRGKLIEQVLLDGERAGPEAEERLAERPLRQMKRRAAFELEDKLIREALTRLGGNVSAAAREMGITPRAVHQKLRSHGIDPVRYRRLRHREDVAPSGAGGA